jgi:hypothetical protein
VLEIGVDAIDFQEQLNQVHNMPRFQMLYERILKADLNVDQQLPPGFNSIACTPFQ